MTTRGTHTHSSGSLAGILAFCNAPTHQVERCHPLPACRVAEAMPRTGRDTSAGDSRPKTIPRNHRHRHRHLAGPKSRATSRSAKSALPGARPGSWEIIFPTTLDKGIPMDGCNSTIRTGWTKLSQTLRRTCYMQSSLIHTLAAHIHPRPPKPPQLIGISVWHTWSVWDIA